MATLEKANGLLEELRGASYDAAVKDMEELKKYAAENVSPAHHALPDLCLGIIRASAHMHLLSRRGRSLYQPSWPCMIEIPPSIHASQANRERVRSGWRSHTS